MTDLMEFPCPACGARLRAPHASAGLAGRCAKCQKQFIVPAEFAIDSAPAAHAPASPAAPMISPFQRPPPASTPKPGMAERIRSWAPMAVMAVVLIVAGWYAWSLVNADEPDDARSARRSAANAAAPAAPLGIVAGNPSMAHLRSDPAKEYHPAPLAKTERAALPVAPVPAAAAAPPPQQPAAQPAPPAPASSAAAPPPSAASAPAPAVAPTPADPPLLARSDQAECPACHGEGSIACPAHCNHGKLRCPASCLKKDDPGWVPGPDGKMWKTFPAHKPGVLGGHKWSTAHIGQLIVYEDGLPVNKGLCPTCQGTGLVDCQKCEGRGSLVCPLCQGAKMVGKKEADAYLAAVAAERQKNAIHLADGRVIRGKIIGKTPDRIIIQTEDGKTELIDPTTIVDSPASGSK